MIAFIFISFFVSMGLLCKNMFDVIMMFPKKGYFVKSGSQEDYAKILDSAKENIQHIGFNIKNSLILSFPVINILYSLYLNHKIKNKIFEEFSSIPNFLKPMTTYDIEKFKKIKGFQNQLDYLLDLSLDSVKKPIIDAEYYEVINHEYDNNKKDKKNSVLDEYRKLRNEVNEVNLSFNYNDKSDDFNLEMKI